MFDRQPICRAHDYTRGRKGSLSIAPTLPYTLFARFKESQDTVLNQQMSGLKGVRATKNAILAGFIIVFSVFRVPVVLQRVSAGRSDGRSCSQARRIARSRLLVLLVPLILEAGIYVFVLNKLAGVVAGYVYRDHRRAGAVLLTLLVGGVAWTLLPVNTFDCMDGHGIKLCSALRIYFGWIPARAPGTSLYVDAQCGDFGW